MKKYFYILISALAVVLTSTVCTYVWQKQFQSQKKQEQLNKYYKDELESVYFFMPDFEAKKINRELKYNYERLGEIKAHMSKDGYNQQQIETMRISVETSQNFKKMYADWGYKDGLNENEPNKDYKNNKFYGIYYQYGFKNGKDKKVKQLKEKNE